ncbi:uncharacterized protein LOC111095684 [Canis lupus familiaris]|uniref:uncharacterized protein LOC111095684 n=1 Tax=Canis lupus familiaris TaxID=9615 RepID=UPI000BAA2EC9|nr:uncharacterized protein LOC111095684 [Canis lupus familiaris]XP_038389695.1 uncharacterized protein LOC111095684 [Canis lupus familiaris]XP_038518245.1 uncharacterized protein LOC111095684 [Canis lupus familiaris]|eukprot:XP_022273682.1 uncharacterized protein LOC111095684 [Canis lupus familiaris]
MLFFCGGRAGLTLTRHGRAKRIDSVNSVLPWKVGRPKPTPHLRLCASSPRSGHRQGETWQPTCLDTTKRKSCIQGLPAPLPSPNAAKVPLLLRHSGSSLTWSACGNLTHGFGATLVSGPCLHKSADSYNQKTNKQKQRPPEPPGLPSLHTSCPVTQAARDPWPRPSSFSPRKASPEARISCGCLDSGAPVHSPHLPRGLDLQGLPALLLVEGDEPVCPSRKCMVKCQSQLQCK